MVHIAYCFDKNYQQHFGVSLTSLLLNYGGDGADLCIHIITDELDHAFSEKLDRLTRTFKAQIDIILLKPNDIEVVARLPAKTEKLAYMSQATWYRVFLADILPPDVTRVLYLDADTIVLSDLNELFNAAMQGAPIAGVIDCCSDEMSARLRLKNYINSGVLLMDLQQWRDKNLVTHCLEHAVMNSEIFTYADQCAINTFFADNIHFLEKKWNRFVTANEKIQEPQGAAILHFITADKPWHAWYENNLAKYYWKYLDVSLWAGAKPAFPQSVDKAHRLARLWHAQGKIADSIRVYENILATQDARLKTV